MGEVLQHVSIFKFLSMRILPTGIINCNVSNKSELPEIWMDTSW